MEPLAGTTRIAVATAGVGIVLIDASDHRLATLTKPRHAGWAEGRDARWSADGRLVVYTLPDDGLAVVGSQGGRPRLLGNGFEPDWSPDAGRIAFTRSPSDTKLDVWVMRANGAGRHRIAPTASTPAWQTRHGGVYASP